MKAVYKVCVVIEDKAEVYGDGNFYGYANQEESCFIIAESPKEACDQVAALLMRDGEDPMKINIAGVAFATDEELMEAAKDSLEEGQ